MTKNTINRPSQPKAAPSIPQAERGQPGAGPVKAKKLEKDSKIKAPPRPQRPLRPQRMGAAHAAAPTADAAAAGEDAGAGGAGVAAAESLEDLHRRRQPELSEADQKQDVRELADDVHETGAIGADAIMRSKGSDSGGDGFEQGQDQREAYERYLKGNVDADKERHDQLRHKGTRDDFSIDRTAAEVEALGSPRASAHVVRLYDAWTLAGVQREEAVGKAASFLAGFASTINIRKVLAELESRPIRDVYPLEILLQMLEERPELLPGVRHGKVLGPIEEKSLLAGHASVITVPADVRIKAFALLGGGRPGYEFQPHKDEGKYTLLVDTPGEHTFAILAAPLQQLGRIQRETSEAILEVFHAVVWAMDKKGEPLSPEQWRARELEEAEDDGEEEEEAAEEASACPGEGEQDIERAANLPTQIRRALETITRDDPREDATGPGAMTYSWDAHFYRPGGPVGVDPILHVVVVAAGPFDAAWMKAREALAAKQKEFEPSRAVVTQEDFTAALRRARVR